MFRAIARFSVKFRWLIIIFWLALVPILSSTLPKISDVSKNNNADFLPKHSAASEAINLEQAFQPKDTSDSSTIIVAREAGPLTDADNQAFDNLLKAVAKVDGVQGVQDKGTSRDGAARQATVSIGSKGVGPQSVTVAKDIRSTLTKALPSGVSAHLAGSFAEAIDADSSNSSGKDNTTLYTVIFILALLLFVFRSLLAPIVTLVPAALALTIAQPLVAKATDWGIEVSFITEILLIVLILGAGTDYGLFLVFRMREELRKGLDVKDAVVEALTKVGESITFSAATVAVALLSLLLASFGLYRGLGPALAIGLAVMLLVALTFLPAVLSVLGRAVFWPSKTTKREQRIGLWGRSGR